MENSNVKILTERGQEYSIVKKAVAHIDPKNCVNCGTCREYCPVGAIEEQQRVICRLCPECTEKPALTFSEMNALATEKSCTTACPLGVMPQGYINLTRIGRENKAFELIWDKNPLPGVCGRICHHPCEQACKRGILVDEPMAIRGIKRFLADSTDYVPDSYPRIYDETVAVIGAGPAGITAAHYLARKGYAVTVFDEFVKAGGMLQRGIPVFRLPREEVDREISRLENAGIKFELGVKIGKKKMEELRSEFDAIIVAAGTPNSKELKISGWRAEGVMTALNFMEHVNNFQSIERHPGQVFNYQDPETVVIGGGAVAFDAARSALRLGAKKVTVVCVESGEDIPCHKWEMDEALEEGIQLMDGWAPQSYICQHSRLEGVAFEKVTDFVKDEDGRISFKTDAEQTAVLKADWAIVAIGQAPDPIWKDYENDEKIYFSGDVKSRACSVVDAMASGKKTANEIDARLRSRDVKDELDLRVLNMADLSEKIYPANRLKIQRPDMPIVPAAERAANFSEVETDYSRELIERETMRCLQCGYQKVDENKCLGCGVCQKICPKGDAITLVPIE